MTGIMPKSCFNFYLPIQIRIHYFNWSELAYKYGIPTTLFTLVWDRVEKEKLYEMNKGH